MGTRTQKAEYNRYRAQIASPENLAEARRESMKKLRRLNPLWYANIDIGSGNQDMMLWSLLVISGLDPNEDPPENMAVWLKENISDTKLSPKQARRISNAKAMIERKSEESRIFGNTQEEGYPEYDSGYSNRY